MFRSLAHALRPLVVVGALLLPVRLAAQNVTIDFEHLPGPDGQLGTADDIPITTTCPPPLNPPCLVPPLITTQYAPLGITFTKPASFMYGPNFWSGHVHWIQNTAMEAAFSVAIADVAITTYSGWTTRLTAYDSADNVVGSAILPHPAPGTFLLEGRLSVTTPQPIAHFSVVTGRPCEPQPHLQPGRSRVRGSPHRLLHAESVSPAGPRGGPALTAGTDRAFPLSGACGLPPTARALQVNMAVTGATSAGHLRLFPGATAPFVSAINYAAGQTRANNAIVSLSPVGVLTVRCGQGSGTVHFIILDVTGYYE